MDSGTEVTPKKLKQLSGEELNELVAFGNSPLYNLLKQISQHYLEQSGLELSKSFVESDVTYLAGLVKRLSGIRIGFNFVLELPEKAKNELEQRKEVKKPTKKKQPVSGNFIN